MKIDKIKKEAEKFKAKYIKGCDCTIGKNIECICIYCDVRIAIDKFIKILEEKGEEK